MVNCRGYFYCSGRSKGACTGSAGIKVQYVADLLLSELNILFHALSPISVTSRITKCTHVSGEHILDNAFRRLQRIKEAYEAGIDTIEEYRCKKERLTAEINIIKKEINSTTAKTKDYSASICFIDVFSDCKVSNEIKKSVLRSFVRRITLTDSEANIELFF